MPAATQPPQQVRSFYQIPGFFWWLDRKVFGAFLQSQQDSPPGDLVELGTYMGRSAVIVGDFLRPGERFVAVDLFGREDLLSDSAQDVMNRDENRRQYKTLNRERFEAYYLQLHKELPYLVEGLTSEVMNHVQPGTARFVHVDAGHMYAQVRIDIANTKTMLRPGGIAVFDDWRSPHTPGVAAAVWEAVIQDGLVPVALTPMKFYGVYDTDPEPYLDVMRRFVRSDRERFWMQQQEIMGRPVLRVGHRKQPAKEGTATPAAPEPPARRIARRIATDIAPPALTRWVAERRRLRNRPR